jgi:hypothetical protein
MTSVRKRIRQLRKRFPDAEIVRSKHIKLRFPEEGMLVVPSTPWGVRSGRRMERDYRRLQRDRRVA